MPTDSKRAMLEPRKTDASKPTWAHVKAAVEKMDRIGLMAVIRDLYDIDRLNRRMLHERFAPSSTTFDRYRRLVRAAVFPDPLSRRDARSAPPTRLAGEEHVVRSDWLPSPHRGLCLTA
jgi:hypothetical protein